MTLTSEQVLNILEFMTRIIKAGLMVQYMEEEFGLTQEEWDDFEDMLPDMANAYNRKLVRMFPDESDDDESDDDESDDK